MERESGSRSRPGFRKEEGGGTRRPGSAPRRASRGDAPGRAMVQAVALLDLASHARRGGTAATAEGTASATRGAHGFALPARRRRRPPQRRRAGRGRPSRGPRDHHATRRRDSRPRQAPTGAEATQPVACPPAQKVSFARPKECPDKDPLAARRASPGAPVMSAFGRSDRAHGHPVVNDVLHLVDGSRQIDVGATDAPAGASVRSPPNSPRLVGAGGHDAPVARSAASARPGSPRPPRPAVRERGAGGASPPPGHPGGRPPIPRCGRA